MSDHEHTKHYGKAMIVTNLETNTVELIIECISCGKFSVKIPLLHMRSVLKMLGQVADSLGLPEETSIVEVQSVTGTDTREEAENIAQQFDHMELEPPWLQKHVSPPSDGNWD